ncbi:MAG: hypothetical protein RJA22_384 [Verrucomicrobiota bacterium]
MNSFRHPRFQTDWPQPPARGAARLSLALCAAWLLLAGLPPQALGQGFPTLQTNSGAGISKAVSVRGNAPGDLRVHVGDTVDVFIRVNNQDGVYANTQSPPLPGFYLIPVQARDTLRFNRIYDVTHYPLPTGKVTNEIFLPSPVILTNLYNRQNPNATGTNSSFQTNFSFVVLPDAAKTNLLFDDAYAQGIDSNNVSGGLSLPFTNTFPAQLRVLAPCIKVTDTCVGASNGVAYFSGSVSNCGNARLLNVVVSNLVGGVSSLAFGPTELQTNQVLFFTGTYAYDTNNPAAPSNTLVAYGTDELDLTVTNSASATCRPCLGDFVWQDANGNGLQDPGEPGIANVTVTLRDCDTGALIRQTLTDANGLYLFCELLPGNYRVEINVPTGYSVTASNVGPNDCLDSDAVTRIASNLWSTACIPFSGNAYNLCVDFGLRPIGALGDFVWEDRNGNGLQDAGEPGIPGVTVQLYNCATQFLGVTITDGSGGYLFPFLPAGGYLVRFVAPPGYQYTLPNVGANDALDSDALTDGYTTCYTLSPGQTNRTVDAGLYQPVCLGDFIWEDRDGDGIQDVGEPGIPGVQLVLQDCTTGGTLRLTNSGPTGLYNFCDLPPGNYRVGITVPFGYGVTRSNVGPNECVDSDASTFLGGVQWQTDCFNLSSGVSTNCVDIGLRPLGAIGDFVWEDYNRNGLQDPGEPGVAGISVELRNCTGQVIATTTTTAGGGYLFTFLPASNYVVRFTSPAGSVFTTPNVGVNDAIDSDADAAGLTACFSLALGETNLTLDAGFTRPCLGDFVWEDRNGNGLQDPGEPGIPNVLLVLRNCTNGSILRQTNSGPAGQYAFCDLPPGNYQVDVTVPAGYGVTTANAGTNDCADSDLSTLVGGNVWRTDCVVFTNAQNNFCIDMGLKPLGAIGDFVWNDVNKNGVQDAGEPGLSNVVVELRNCSGQLIASTLTDTAGGYLFTFLPASNYVVRFVAPGGLGFTLQNVGDDAKDSDADASGFTACFPLALGETNRTVDAGLIPICPPYQLVCAPNQSYECTALLAATNLFTPPTVVGGLGVVVTVVSTDANTNTICPGKYTLTRTWQAVDACTNIQRCSQTITIVDTTPPNITCGDSLIVECNQPWSFTPPYAVDGCDGTNIVVRMLGTVTNAVSPRCPGLTNIVRTTATCAARR